MTAKNTFCISSQLYVRMFASKHHKREIVRTILLLMSRDNKTVASPHLFIFYLFLCTLHCCAETHIIKECWQRAGDFMIYILSNAFSFWNFLDKVGYFICLVIKGGSFSLQRKFWTSFIIFIHYSSLFTTTDHW